MDKLAKTRWTYVPASSRHDAMKMVKYHFFDEKDEKDDKLRETTNDHDEDGELNGSERETERLRDGFIILFSDLTHLFVSRSSLAEIKEKFSAWNPILNVTSDDHLLALVRHCLTAFCKGGVDFDGTKVKEIVEQRENQSSYKLEVALQLKGGIRFQWTFDASLLAPRYLQRHLTVPSLRRRLTLKAENRRLKALLRAKDAEIEDMKLSGAKVSRKMLETQKFVDDDDHVGDAEEDEPTDDWLRSVEEEAQGRCSKKKDIPVAAASSSLTATDASLNPIANNDNSSRCDKPDSSPTKSSSTSDRKRSSSPPIASSVSLSQPPDAKEKAAKLRKKKLGL